MLRQCLLETGVNRELGKLSKLLWDCLLCAFKVTIITVDEKGVIPAHMSIPVGGCLLSLIAN